MDGGTIAIVAAGITVSGGFVSAAWIWARKGIGDNGKQISGNTKAIGDLVDRMSEQHDLTQKIFDKIDADRKAAGDFRQGVAGVLGAVCQQMKIDAEAMGKLGKGAM